MKKITCEKNQINDGERDYTLCMFEDGVEYEFIESKNGFITHPIEFIDGKHREILDLKRMNIMDEKNPLYKILSEGGWDYVIVHPDQYETSSVDYCMTTKPNMLRYERMKKINNLLNDNN